MTSAVTKQALRGVGSTQAAQARRCMRLHLFDDALGAREQGADSREPLGVRPARARSIGRQRALLSAGHAAYPTVTLQHAARVGRRCCLAPAVAAEQPPLIGAPDRTAATRPILLHGARRASHIGSLSHALPPLLLRHVSHVAEGGIRGANRALALFLLGTVPSAHHLLLSGIATSGCAGRGQAQGPHTLRCRVVMSICRTACRMVCFSTAGSRPPTPPPCAPTHSAPVEARRCAAAAPGLPALTGSPGPSWQAHACRQTGPGHGLGALLHLQRRQKRASLHGARSARQAQRGRAHRGVHRDHEHAEHRAEPGAHHARQHCAHAAVVHHVLLLHLLRRRQHQLLVHLALLLRLCWLRLQTRTQLSLIKR